MNLKYLNPFLATCITSIKESTGIDVKKQTVNVVYGKKLQGTLGLVFKVEGDLQSTIYFDFPASMSKYIIDKITTEQGISVHEADRLDENPLITLGRDIAKRAISILFDKGIKCTISDPYVYSSSGTTVIPDDVPCIDIGFKSEKLGLLKISITNPQDSFFKNDAILFYGVEQEVIDIAIFSLIPRGLLIYNPQNVEELQKTLTLRKINFLFIDTSYVQYNLDNFIQDCIEKSIYKDFSVILYSNVDDGNPLRYSDFTKNKVLGIIKKTNNFDKLGPKLIKFLSTEGLKENERRKDVRIRFSKEEGARISFRMPNSNTMIRGTVLNISIGGLTFVPDKNEYYQFLKVGKEIKGASILLNKRYYISDIIIHAVRGKFISARFIETKDSFIKSLAEFIHSQFDVVI